jgi:hypothetical protein
MKSKREILNDWGYHVTKLDDLTRLMNAAGSDKGLGLYGRHYYTRVYRELFAPLRDQPINFVEIGLLRPDRDRPRSSNAAEGVAGVRATSAPSLEAWRAYFSKARIFGFDIDDFRGVKLSRVTILQGDMDREEDLQAIVDACGAPIDVVIDDGSHVSHHQQKAFACLFPAVRPGGLYIIEDCHWQDPSLEKPGATKTRDVFSGFRRNGHLESVFVPQANLVRLAADIASVRSYDSIEPKVDDTEDALCVIRKR